MPLIDAPSPKAPVLVDMEQMELYFFFMEYLFHFETGRQEVSYKPWTTRAQRHFAREGTN
jgi:hypothetical protein